MIYELGDDKNKIYIKKNIFYSDFLLFKRNAASTLVLQKASTWFDLCYK